MRVITSIVSLILSVFYFATKIMGIMVFTFSATAMFLLTEDIRIAIFAGVMALFGMGIAVTIEGLAKGWIKVPNTETEEQ